MVRTFSFNPSTQSVGDVLPGANPIKQYDANQNLIIPNASPNYYRPNVPSSTRMESQFLDNATDDRHQTAFGRHEPKLDHSITSLAYSLSNASTSSTESAASPSPPAHPSTITAPALVVEDGSSSLFAIRSLLINGQRFYQPVDLNNLSQPIFGGTMSNGHANSVAQNGHHNTRPLRQCMSEEHLTRTPATSALISAMLSQSNHFKQGTTHSLPPHGIPAANRDHRLLDSRASSEKRVKPTERAMNNDLPWARGNPQPKSGKRGSQGWGMGQTTPSFTDNQFITGTSPHRPLDLSNSYGSFYSELSSVSAYKPSSNVPQFATTPEQRLKMEKEQHKMELMRQIEDNKRRKYLEKQKEWEQEERERMKNEIYAQRMRNEIEEEERRARQKAMLVEKKAEQVAAVQKATMDFIAKEKAEKGSNRSRKAISPNDRPASPIEAELKYQQSNAEENHLEWWEKKNNWNERGRSPVIPALRSRNPDQAYNDENMPTNDSQGEIYGNGNKRHIINSSSSRRSLSNHSETMNSREIPDFGHNAYQSNRPESRPIRPTNRARSNSRSSRLSYQSSIEASQDRRSGNLNRTRIEGSEAIRNLSALQRNLEEENDRVKDAIERNNYGRHVFD
ncbi:hypothetical protein DdX_02084 [Ditylenchus destructor]|uniref:CCDC66 domain-containing protein n=1 Tax=Ditylenchus destructor TaxID=166010 RepID=A0AAD4NFG5_9BILA|nr:hypothetical protein DdX_02084 [Ditylenchus destructor]